MAMQNPSTWGWERLQKAGRDIGGDTPEQHWRDGRRHDGAIVVRRIGLRDIGAALAAGWRDFEANRTDVIFLSVIYPVAGLLLWQAATGNGLIPLLFPLASGFALVGPLAAVGLNEMSRRREQGDATGWRDAFGALRAPSIGAIVLLGAMLVAIFLFWLVVAQVIYAATLGPTPPVTLRGFVDDVFGTSAGMTLILAGVGAGFLFAVLVLAIGGVSFPLLLDRNVGINTAVATSVRVIRENPDTMAVWGLVVAGLLLLGSLPLLVGLAVVMPVLGHATWHLYRRAVAE
jgi:uncharacterized membrane protein